MPRECRPGETRVAATPETVRRLSARGCLLQVEQGAGIASGFDDAAYGEAGAQLIDPAAEAAESWSLADVVLAVQAAPTFALAKVKAAPQAGACLTLPRWR